MESWTLQELIINRSKNWYLIFLFIFLGSLVGFGFSYLYPAPYRAVANLYVGIDITRVNEMEYLIPLAKEEPLNLDDYKNWQLKQVSSILTSDAVLEQMIPKLQEEPGWESIDVDELRKSLDLYWFDTGTWQLEALFKDQKQAEFVAQTWLDTGHQFISQLLEISEEVARLDAELFAYADEIGLLKSRVARLKTFLESSDEWMILFEELPQNDPLDLDTRAELSAWILVYQKNNSYWQIPVGDFPQEEEGASAYLVWLEGAQRAANIDLEESESVLVLLKNERELVLPEYHEYLDDSLGLSANLVLQPNISASVVEETRSTGNFTLGGGIVGLLCWLIISLMYFDKSRK